MVVLAQKSSQVVLHMSVAFGVTYICTGSLATGGIAALLEPICNVVLLPLHDRLWKKAGESRKQMRKQEPAVLAASTT
jgi:uncharacterized membrane protein